MANHLWTVATATNVAFLPIKFYKAWFVYTMVRSGSRLRLAVEGAEVVAEGADEAEVEAGGDRRSIRVGGSRGRN